MIRTFDIANVMVKQSSRGQGVFREFVSYCETLNRPIYIENVTEPRLLGFFIKRGYLSCEPLGSLTPCFIRIPGDANAPAPVEE